MLNYCRGSNSSAKTGVCVRIILMLCAVYVWCGFCSGTAFPGPKQNENTKPGDCIICHGDQKVLPAAHVKTDGMTYKRCLGCHQKTGEAKKPGTLRGKMTSGHMHQLSGISCSDCHGKERPATSPEGQKCLDCHADYKTNLVLTDKALPSPHQSHMGELDCLLCHHVHARSENFCAQCHHWKYSVP